MQTIEREYPHLQTANVDTTIASADDGSSMSDAEGEDPIPMPPASGTQLPIHPMFTGKPAARKAIAPELSAQ